MSRRRDETFTIYLTSLFSTKQANKKNNKLKEMKVPEEKLKKWVNKHDEKENRIDRVPSSLIHHLRDLNYVLYIHYSLDIIPTIDLHSFHHHHHRRLIYVLRK